MKIIAGHQTKHGEVEYYLKQVLTGHGCFKTYLKKYHIRENDKCDYCGQTDSPAHTIFECMRWKEVRTETQENWENKGDHEEYGKE